ncbi:Hsp20/alpha crystallin family protein [Chitinimonas sp. BJB300]|uniref:Hsp20/alpha crystallin family protein n=1 Tax=Chitinimonas sp. BJB300 TaxID=1559339 RepID=UPI000C11DB18|nr:Hsp20 family protein [Chitinimonas sp. BJB300]PHV09760.1 heat-shock protein Hsp20 [Chitinimonas sp. BJB300]TSJ84540.1 Hsp20 family protein [Chitinimonas sp. BJB300]
MSLLPAPRTLFDDLFQDFSPGFFIRPLNGDPLPAQIKLDVRELEDRFEVQAELPGVAKEDISIEVEGTLVTLSAEIKQIDSQYKDERLLRMERYSGLVSRSFHLPAEVSNTEANARFENGLLMLTLPKKQPGSSNHKVMIS